MSNFFEDWNTAMGNTVTTEKITTFFNTPANQTNMTTIAIALGDINIDYSAPYGGLTRVDVLNSLQMPISFEDLNTSISLVGTFIIQYDTLDSSLKDQIILNTQLNFQQKFAFGTSNGYIADNWDNIPLGITQVSNYFNNMGEGQARIQYDGSSVNYTDTNATSLEDCANKCFEGEIGISGQNDCAGFSWNPSTLNCYLSKSCGSSHIVADPGQIWQTYENKDSTSSCNEEKYWEENQMQANGYSNPVAGYIGGGDPYNLLTKGLYENEDLVGGSGTSALTDGQKVEGCASWCDAFAGAPTTDNGNSTTVCKAFDVSLEKNSGNNCYLAPITYGECETTGDCTVGSAGSNNWVNYNRDWQGCSTVTTPSEFPVTHYNREHKVDKRLATFEANSIQECANACDIGFPGSGGSPAGCKSIGWDGTTCTLSAGENSNDWSQDTTLDDCSNIYGRDPPSNASSNTYAWKYTGKVPATAGGTRMNCDDIEVPAGSTCNSWNHVTDLNISECEALCDSTPLCAGFARSIVGGNKGNCMLATNVNSGWTDSASDQEWLGYSRNAGQVPAPVDCTKEWEDWSTCLNGSYELTCAVGGSNSANPKATGTQTRTEIELSPAQNGGTCNLETESQGCPGTECSVPTGYSLYPYKRCSGKDQLNDELAGNYAVGYQNIPELGGGGTTCSNTQDCVNLAAQKCTAYNGYPSVDNNNSSERCVSFERKPTTGWTAFSTSCTEANMGNSTASTPYDLYVKPPPLLDDYTKTSWINAQFTPSGTSQVNNIEECANTCDTSPISCKGFSYNPSASTLNCQTTGTNCGSAANMINAPGYETYYENGTNCLNIDTLIQNAQSVSDWEEILEAMNKQKDTNGIYPISILSQVTQGIINAII